MVVGVEMEQNEHASVMNRMGEGRKEDCKNDPQMSALCRGWRHHSLRQETLGEDSVCGNRMRRQEQGCVESLLKSL